eukprot:8006848-Pyramimonas_sp.AAC.1
MSQQFVSLAMLNPGFGSGSRCERVQIKRFSCNAKSLFRVWPATHEPAGGPQALPRGRMTLPTEIPSRGRDGKGRKKQRRMRTRISTRRVGGQ